MKNDHPRPARRDPGRGASRRIGVDKAELVLDGETLIARVHRRIAQQASPVMVSRHGHGTTDPSGTIPVTDASTGHQGPLAGILAALDHLQQTGSQATHMISVAVDTPFFPNSLVERLSEPQPARDEIVLAGSKGRAHPVFALWPVVLRGDLECWFSDRSNRRLMDFIGRHTSQVVDFAAVTTPQGPVDPFFNINTPQDLDTARLIAKMMTDSR
nr:NTP transferase domain-containing protein [Marinicella sp. W31]MDC2876001.1 NTP transferase domain-containing protein [Marinicella sp. W31]